MENEINEMYIKYCREFVDENVTVTPHSQVYMLSQTLEGMDMALKDWVAFSKFIQHKFNISDQTFMDLTLEFQLKVKGV